MAVSSSKLIVKLMLKIAQLVNKLINLVGLLIWHVGSGMEEVVESCQSFPPFISQKDTNINTFESFYFEIQIKQSTPKHAYLGINSEAWLELAFEEYSPPQALR